MGPRTRGPEECSRQRDERGAEMVEFAFVVVLLIMLLYGIVSYGLILSAQSTVTQAAEDGARAGIVATTNPQSAAEIQAGNDVSWMGKGQCYERDVPAGVATADGSHGNASKLGRVQSCPGVALPRRVGWPGVGVEGKCTPV